MAYPALAPSDILEFVIFGRLFGQVTNNTFAYNADVVVGNQTMLDAFTNFAVHFEDEYTAVCSLDWTGYQITVRRVTPNPTRAIPFAIEWTGDVDAGGTLPPSTTGVISRVSWEAGRQSLGRIFVPAVPAEWHSDGLLVAPGIAAYNALGTKMAADIVDGTDLVLQPVILGPDGLPRDVEQCITRTILRQQRRREIDVGI